MDSELKMALIEGYEAALAESGFFRKLLTIGALVAGTIFSGCSAGGKQQLTLGIPENTPVNRDSVTELALRIADGIHSEIQDSSRVEDTESWKAAKKIYDDLNKGDTKALANTFSRIINRENLDLSAPPCCGETAYNNKENNTLRTGGTYNADDNTWEY